MCNYTYVSYATLKDMYSTYLIETLINCCCFLYFVILLFVFFIESSQNNKFWNLIKYVVQNRRCTKSLRLEIGKRDYDIIKYHKFGYYCFRS